MSWHRALLSQICLMLWIFDKLKSGLAPVLQTPPELVL